MGNTGITFAPGDMIDIIIDPIAKTIQEVKNGGTPSGAFSISTLSTQNVSPAISTCAINDSMTFNGNPTGVSYTGAIAWDAVDSPIFTSLSITCGTSCSFVPGTSSAIGTVTANISSGPNTPAWSLKTTGTDSATGLITCYPNASGYFSINGSSGIITVSAAAPANTYKVCAQDTQSGVGGSPFSQAFSLTGGSPPPATFVANFSDVHQTMDGFGGSDAWRSDMNPYNLDAYFCINASDPGCSGPGIGLTLLREGTSSTDGITQSDTVPDPPPPDGSISSRTAAIGAKARGATLFATPWIVTTSNYTAAAQGIVDWVNSQTAAGIPVYAVATQNEPDCGCNGGYVWNPGQVAALVDVLGPMLHSLSPPVKMMAPEVAFPPSDFINYVAALESDSTANAQTDIFTTHQYGDITGSPSDGTRHMWQTEVSPGSSWDPSIGNAMGESMHWMYDAIVTAGVNAWSYWQLACGSGCDNGGLAGDFSPSSPMSDNVPKRYYAVGNWSKFVRPGWVRVGVTGSASGISPIAFKDPVSGKFAIVVLDYNGSGDSSVTFGIQNATISGNVTPYVTSGTPIGVIGTDGNLSAGSVSSGIPASLPASGGVFTSALPYGVTTFVGQSH
jgi:glucuronoarabinoxylan endo-1,4-beta-xylanase